MIDESGACPELESRSLGVFRLPPNTHSFPEFNNYRIEVRYFGSLSVTVVGEVCNCDLAGSAVGHGSLAPGFKSWPD